MDNVSSLPDSPVTIEFANGAAQQDLGVSLKGFLASIEVGALIAIIQIGGFVIFQKRARLKWTSDRVRNVFRDIDHPDLDVVGLFRVLRFLTVVFLVTGALLVPILLPINYVRPTSDSKVRGLDRFSCLNILASETYRLWVHLIAAFSFTFYVCFKLKTELDNFSSKRCSVRKTKESKLFLVTDIPDNLPWADIKQLFERIFNARNRVIIFSISTLDHFNYNDQRLMSILDGIEVSLTPNKTRRSEHDIDTKVGTGFEELKKHLDKIVSERPHNHRGRKDIAVVEIIETGRTHIGIPGSALWPCKVYPIDKYLSTVNWNDARRIRSRRRMVRIPMTILTVASLAILALPISFSASLSQITELAENTSWLFWVHKISPWAMSYIQGVIPQLIVALIVALTPSLLRKLSEKHGLPTVAQVDLVFHRYYSIFLFLQAFLLISISSSISLTLSEILQKPSSIPRVLALNLPKAGNYFLSYLTLQGFSMFAEMVAQWRYLVRKTFRSCFSSMTPRQIALQRTEELFSLPSMYPVVTLMGVIGFTYSIITPLLFVPTSIGSFALLVAFKPALEEFRPRNSDTAGELYYSAITHLFAGLYIMQLCLAGIFLSVEDEGGKPVCQPQASLVLLLFASTLSFHCYMCWSTRSKITSMVSPLRPVSPKGRANIKQCISGPVSLKPSHHAQVRETPVMFARLKYGTKVAILDDPTTVFRLGWVADLDRGRGIVDFKIQALIWVSEGQVTLDPEMPSIVQSYLDSLCTTLPLSTDVLLETSADGGSPFYKDEYRIRNAL